MSAGTGSQGTAGEETDEVFRALADPSRRRLLDSLNARNGQRLRELCAGLDMTRQSVSKHLAILEAANLVTTRRQGREKLHYLNPEPVNAIAERWISQYHRERVRALADLKTALEQPMSSTEFVYTSYIATTPEKLWQALTDPAFTSRYWGATFTSDWTAGSRYSWHQFGVTIASPEMVVLESEPYRRLSYTWHTFTPEFAETVGFTGEFQATVAAEPRSKVTFELEPAGPLVKLTVVHDGFEPGSLVLSSVSQGWPAILSNLKTLLETGETLPAATTTRRRPARAPRPRPGPTRTRNRNPDTSVTAQPGPSPGRPWTVPLVRCRYVRTPEPDAAQRSMYIDRFRAGVCGPGGQAGSVTGRPVAASVRDAAGRPAGITRV